MNRRTTDVAAPDLPRAPGVVVALPGEARPLAKLRSLGQADLAGGGRLMLAGLGARRAGEAARQLAASGVDGLISWGTAAALVHGLAPGDLVLAHSVRCVDGSRFETDGVWRARLRTQLHGDFAICEGLLAETDDILADIEAKQRAQVASGADACDMESAAIARVAAEFGLPFVVIRAVVDDATMILPPAARAAVSESGSLQPWSLARSLMGRPSSMHAQLRSLKHLGVAFRAARMTLGHAAQALRTVSSD